ncbi:CRISPR system precrRNA processing endoribonuclease RAMP protein Cas6 [Streptomyces sp. NPDC004838]
MPTTWTLRLRLTGASPYPPTPGQLNGLACSVTEHPGSDHTAQTKPFSISPLFHDTTDPTHHHWFLRIGWLDDTHPLDLTHLPGQRLRLGHNHLTVTDTRHHHTPYAELQKHPPVARADFTFHSATYFKSSGTWVPAPDPKLLFPGLLRRWNTYAPTPITRDQTNQFIPSIAITHHDVRTAPVALPKTNRTGFLGTATFTLTTPATTTWLFPALCRLAASTGVGAQTTHGLGHVHVHLHST